MKFDKKAIDVFRGSSYAPDMATLKGSSPPDWGIPADLLSLLTQKVSITNKMDKKEARDHAGDVSAVAYYNQVAEISIEGIGEVTQALAANITVSDDFSDTNLTSTGVFIAEEVTYDYSNEDFVRSSVKGTAYVNITS